MIWISGLPADLEPGEYDVKTEYIRLIRCRDGSLETVIETTYVGPCTSPDDPHLIRFTKHGDDQR